MYQNSINHPANKDSEPLASEVFDAMFDLFAQICAFWNNLDDPGQYRSRLFTFMDNRMRLRPEYRGYYISARQTMIELVATMGKDEAYRKLFTDPSANQSPPTTPLALVRQKVSNEFVAFQVSQGGFKAFTGAINYPNFIAGAYVPGEHAPYRTP